MFLYSIYFVWKVFTRSFLRFPLFFPIKSSLRYTTSEKSRLSSVMCQWIWISKSCAPKDYDQIGCIFNRKIYLIYHIRKETCFSSALCKIHLWKIKCINVEIPSFRSATSTYSNLVDGREKYGNWKVYFMKIYEKQKEAYEILKETRR